MGKKRKLIEAWEVFEINENEIPCKNIKCSECKLNECAYITRTDLISIEAKKEMKEWAIQWLKDHPKKQKIDIEPDWSNASAWRHGTYLARVWNTSCGLEYEPIPGTERTRPSCENMQHYRKE